RSRSRSWTRCSIRSSAAWPVWRISAGTAVPPGRPAGRRRRRTCWPRLLRPPGCAPPGRAGLPRRAPTARPTPRNPARRSSTGISAARRSGSREGLRRALRHGADDARGLMRQLTLAVPPRRSRRQRRRPGGPRTDMRATLRQARRTGGDAFRLISRAPALRRRRLVVLCDISGSMEPYGRAMIQLLYCAAGGASAEVFSFATRLTRLTPAQAAPDWLGGTRIGAALKEFNDSYGAVAWRAVRSW